jgi:hypothetical protein
MDNKDLGISKPTKEEIVQTRQKIADKYNIALSDTDALRYTELSQQLRWWVGLKHAGSIADDVKNKLGKIYLDNQEQEKSSLNNPKLLDGLIENIAKEEIEKIKLEMTTIIMKNQQL